LAESNWLGKTISHKLSAESTPSVESEQAMTQNPQLFIRRADRTYGVTIQDSTVWIERQITPLAGDNRPTHINDRELYDGTVWNLDLLDAALVEYEGIDDDE